MDAVILFWFILGALYDGELALVYLIYIIITCNKLPPHTAQLGRENLSSLRYQKSHHKLLCLSVLLMCSWTSYFINMVVLLRESSVAWNIKVIKPTQKHCIMNLKLYIVPCWKSVMNPWESTLEINKAFIQVVKPALFSPLLCPSFFDHNECDKYLDMNI